MVEYTLPLDSLFGSLADPTRRDILSRLQLGRLNVSEIAEPYDMSLAAVSKHLKILEQAKLIMKRRKGKEQIVSLQPATMMQAADYFKQYEQMWAERFDRLEMFLKEEEV
jgi:DNA-binding transcriptional ArsR family regulator